MKAMHRAIVTSATYRQASRVSPEGLAKDPENRLLARGPRVRLEAEMIRDSVLEESGLLCERIGGPSVFPPQPPGVSSEGAYGGLAWNPSPGGDRYRRGLYTFTKRTAPFAMTLTFDGPSGEVCVARREMSNSPLQALTLLNDPVFVEGSQALGRLDGEDPGGSRSAGRPVVPAVPVTGAASRRVIHACPFLCRISESGSSGKSLTPPRLRVPAAGGAIDRAAWTLLARAILNLDEAVTKG